MNRLAALACGPLLAATALVCPAQEGAPPAVTAAIDALLPNTPPAWVKPAPMSGLWEVAVGSHVFYVSADGRYLLRGDILDTTTRENLTRPARNRARHDAVESLGEANMIVFEPRDPRYTVTVFTDVECGYCQKLHNEMQSYLDAGIRVRYLAFPRAGIGSPTYQTMVSVWCAVDPRDAMTRAKTGREVEAKSCPNPVAEQYQAGQMLGVRGTPTIVLESGEVVPGYLPADRLREAAEVARNEVKG